MDSAASELTWLTLVGHTAKDLESRNRTVAIRIAAKAETFASKRLTSHLMNVVRMIHSDMLQSQHCLGATSSLCSGRRKNVRWGAKRLRQTCHYVASLSEQLRLRRRHPLGNVFHARDSSGWGDLAGQRTDVI